MRQAGQPEVECAFANLGLSKAAADSKKIKKRAIFSLPYEAFTEDEYTLSGADYDEAWQLIRAIRESYTRLAAIVNKGAKR